jgi:hypothetical protein
MYLPFACMLVCLTNCVYAPFLCFTLFNWPADDVRLSISLSLCPSVYVFVCLIAISLSVHFLCLFMCPSFHLSAHLTNVMSLFVHLYVSLFISVFAFASALLYLCYLLVHFPSDSLSICLFILMSVCPPVCLFTFKLPSTKPHPLTNKTLQLLQAHVYTFSSILFLIVHLKLVFN